jgi:hypothetical protein
VRERSRFPTRSLCNPLDGTSDHYYQAMLHDRKIPGKKWICHSATSGIFVTRRNGWSGIISPLNYRAFLFRSAQRCFIMSEMRLREAALICRRFRLGPVAAW